MSKIEINYRAFIEDYFYLKNKQGEIVPFIFNEVQALWYDQLLGTYGPSLQGIRENDLKGRQFGISTIISGIFTTDFILSEIGEIPITDSDIYSYKDAETNSHFARVNMFVDSFMLKSQGGDYAIPEHRQELPKLRAAFLRSDNSNQLIGKKYGARYSTQTASAKISGRGDTKLNVHWSEVAFYPNTEIMSAENLVTAAEEQVPQNLGKIFRESTGNMLGDFFANEYYKGKDNVSDFHSRFMAWYLMPSYTLQAPGDFQLPSYYEHLVKTGIATTNQCYWHYKKTRNLTDKKKLREYPTYDFEAFLLSGSTFFDPDAMIFHLTRVKQPLKEVAYAQAL
jgi:hypothetical protein